MLERGRLIGAGEAARVWRLRAGTAGGGAGLGWRRPGGQRRTGGAGTARARERLRSSSVGEMGSHAGGGAVESFGRGGGAVYGRGCSVAVSRGGRDTVSETDAWARGKIK